MTDETTPTKRRILDAALELFLVKGIDGTAVTDIEAGAGLSPGSGAFYRHYGSKDAVLDAVLEDTITRSSQAVEARLRAAPPAGGADARTLETQYLLALAMLDDMKPLIQLVAREHARLPELARHLRERFVEPGVRQEGALVTGRDAEDVGAVVLSALVGFHLARTFFGVAPGALSDEEFARALARMVEPLT